MISDKRGGKQMQYCQNTHVILFKKCFDDTDVCSNAKVLLNFGFNSVAEEFQIVRNKYSEIFYLIIYSRPSNLGHESFSPVIPHKK